MRWSVRGLRRAILEVGVGRWLVSVPGGYGGI
jgi:hypothetical protein